MLKKLAASLLVACSIATVSAFGEEQTQEALKTHYIMFVKAHKLNFDSLNGYIKEKGVDMAVNDIITTSTISGTLQAGNLIGTLEGGLFYQNNESDNGNYKSTVTSNFTAINIGYIVAKAGAFNLYPMIGYTQGNLQFSIVKKDTANFDTLLSNPGSGSVRMQKNTYGINIGGGIGFSSENLPLISLHGGYTLPIASSSWLVNDIRVNNGPDTNMGGPYVQFSIGY